MTNIRKREMQKDIAVKGFDTFKCNNVEMRITTNKTDDKVLKVNLIVDTDNLHLIQLLFNKPTPEMLVVSDDNRELYFGKYNLEKIEGNKLVMRIAPSKLKCYI